MQTESPQQCQEIATPFGLATTLVLSGCLVQALPYSVCTIKSDLLHLSIHPILDQIVHDTRIRQCRCITQIAVIVLCNLAQYSPHNLA